MKKLIQFALLLLSGHAFAATLTGIAISPQGAVLPVGSSLVYSVVCTYSDSSTDNCTNAGGATWSTTTAAITMSGSTATWGSGYDPHNATLFPSGQQTALGLVYVAAGGMQDVAQILAQSTTDSFIPYMTPDPAFYQDIQTNTSLPINVVVGSTVTIGAGYVDVVSGTSGGSNPFQMTCNWSSSNNAIATITRYGLATAVSPGSVTMTCGQAGSGAYSTATGSGLTFAFVVTAPTLTSRTWYVRPNGGTPYVNGTQTPAGQCDGLHDADYSGTGVDQPCAVGNLRYLWTDEVTHNNEQWIIGPGDTVIVRQNSAGYNLGSDQWSEAYGGSAYAPVNCGNPDCYMPTIPSGTAAQHTRILGENYANCHADSAKTILNVTWAAKFGINVGDSQYVDVACFEITDQAACAYNGNYTNHCVNNSTTNYGVWGLRESAMTSDTTYTDLLIDGLAQDGIYGATGAGVVASYVHIRAMPDAGVNMDDNPHGLGNISVAGGITMNYSITEFTGCVEEYPIVHNYPYIECRDQELDAYGDGFGTGSTTGSWIFDHDIWRYNYQDGLDLLHSGLQYLSVTNSQSYGNDGQAFKMGSANNVIFQGNTAVANCNRLSQVIGDEPSSAIVPGATYCRAGGGWIAMQFVPYGTYSFQNNSLAGYGDVALGYSCVSGGDNCSSANSSLQNNVFLAYSTSAFNGGEESAMLCAVVGSNCNENLGDFPANQGWATRSNNIYYNTRSCPNALTTDETCNTVDPLFVGEPATPISNETVLDSYNFTPATGSPLIGGGTTYAGIPSVDPNGVTTPSPPDIGAFELNAINYMIQGALIRGSFN